MGLERVIVAISLAVGDMHRGPTKVDVTLYFRGNANETPPKSSHNQSHDLCFHLLLHSNQSSPHLLDLLCWIAGFSWSSCSFLLLCHVLSIVGAALCGTLFWLLSTLDLPVVIISMSLLANTSFELHYLTWFCISSSNFISPIAIRVLVGLPLLLVSKEQHFLPPCSRSLSVLFVVYITANETHWLLPILLHIILMEISCKLCRNKYPISFVIIFSKKAAKSFSLLISLSNSYLLWVCPQPNIWVSDLFDAQNLR